MITLWFNRPCGEDLLTSMPLSHVQDFLQQLIYRGSASEVFTEDNPPIFNREFWYEGLLPHAESDVLQINGMHVFVCAEGFEPPSFTYSKIFYDSPKHITWIITGIPRPYKEKEIEKEVNPNMRGFLANQDGFRKFVLKETMRQMPPRFFVAKNMEEYLTFFLQRTVNLTEREEPYDLRRGWKTKEELDAELDAYMSC